MKDQRLALALASVKRRIDIIKEVVRKNPRDKMVLYERQSDLETLYECLFDQLALSKKFAAFCFEEELKSRCWLQIGKFVFESKAWQTEGYEPVDEPLVENLPTDTLKEKGYVIERELNRYLRQLSKENEAKYFDGMTFEEDDDDNVVDGLECHKQ